MAKRSAAAKGPPRVDIISIGTLARNLLWGESQPTRTAHATTTLIRAGARNILVDPGLPGQVVAARLFERAGLRPEQIDTLFFTNFRPDHRAGFSLFTSAKILMNEIEIHFSRAQLERLIEQAPPDDLDRKLMQADLLLLEKIQPAEDKLVEGVDLFPLAGFTPGTSGLLIAAPLTTTIIAGDAVPTMEHFLAGQVTPESHDIKQAHESLAEVYEIADVIVPGHDNLFMNPRGRG